MGSVTEMPVKKLLNYFSVHGFGHGPEDSGWRVTHHYLDDGAEEDFEFLFSEADKLAAHLWELTGGRLEG